MAQIGKIGVLRGSLFGGVFGLLGAVLQGGGVAETIGSGLLSGAKIGPSIGNIILIIGGSLIAIGVLAHIPIPTVFAVVGSVLGAGIGIGAVWNLAQVKLLLIVWAITPFIAVASGYILSKILRRYLSRRGDSKKWFELTLFAMGAFAAYSGGTNLVGVAMGILSATIDLHMQIILILGGIIILIGALTGGPRMVSAVARDYSELGILRAISALGAAAILIQVATFLGIPLSFNETIIGSIIGSGLVVGRGGINPRKIAKTGSAWVLTLAGSITISWAIVSGFLYIT